MTTATAAPVIKQYALVWLASPANGDKDKFVAKGSNMTTMKWTTKPEMAIWFNSEAEAKSSKFYMPGFLANAVREFLGG